MEGGEWLKLFGQIAISLATGIAGIIIGVWRWGQWDSTRLQGMRDDYDSKIEALREERRKVTADYERAQTERMDALVAQFTETFNGLRRQLDEHRLITEREFLRKQDFREFREEFRSDMRDIKRSLSSIMGGSNSYGDNTHE